jgi:TolB-like protein
VERLSLLWRRINDHKMVQWSIAYIAVAYGLQHGVVLTSEAFDWPHAVARISMLLLALGLPVVMTLAWYHGERASRRISGPELTIISILLVMSSLLFYVFVRPSEEVAAGPRPVVQQASVEAARSAPTTQAGAISIAVLPFANLSGDAGQEFFSDGMTEEIMTALARVSALRIVGRESAFRFKGQKTDMLAVGQALGASYFIEGSVRKEGTRVRITAQLVQADSSLSLWTNSYDRELTSVFATQEDIAQAIAGALGVPLGLKQGDSLVRNRTKDLESYDQYLRAKALVRARGLKPVTDAASLLEQVVTRDPGYAPGWALLAQAYVLTPRSQLANYGGTVEEIRRFVDAFFPKAEVAARRAIQLDANLADGYASLGYVQGPRGKLLLAEDIPPEALKSGDRKKIIPPLHGALLKNEQDVHLFERLVFLSRTGQ